jgi:hypothetical protein
MLGRSAQLRRDGHAELGFYSAYVRDPDGNGVEVGVSLESG